MSFRCARSNYCCCGFSRFGSRFRMCLYARGWEFGGFTFSVLYRVVRIKEESKRLRLIWWTWWVFDESKSCRLMSFRWLARISLRRSKEKSVYKVKMCIVTWASPPSLYEQITMTSQKRSRCSYLYSAGRTCRRTWKNCLLKLIT